MLGFLFILCPNESVTKFIGHIRSKATRERRKKNETPVLWCAIVFCLMLPSECKHHEQHNNRKKNEIEALLNSCTLDKFVLRPERRLPVVRKKCKQHSVRKIHARIEKKNGTNTTNKQQSKPKKLKII